MFDIVSPTLPKPSKMLKAVSQEEQSIRMSDVTRIFVCLIGIVFYWNLCSDVSNGSV